MVRHTDMKIIVMKEKVFYPYRPQETGGTTYHSGPLGEAPGSIRRQREWRKYRQVSLLSFPLEGLGEAG